MIGYNERQEAENLLNLLNESRPQLSEFNRICWDVIWAVSRGPEMKNAVFPVALQRLEQLVTWARDMRQSGLYALCFSDAREVQRKPYDLLARLEPQEWETEEAALDASLLQGLTEPEMRRARRLYQRLLYIQPLRMLLARLYLLEDAVQKGDDERTAAMVEVVSATDFFQPIPLTMERKSGQRLDLRDNDFTILDRLMDNWDRPLRQETEVRLPANAFDYAVCARSLMTAAIVHNLNGVPADGCGPYCAIPGGHIALGVYDREKKPAAFFKAVEKAMSQKTPRLLNVHGYADVRLVQLTREGAGCFRCLRTEDDFCGADDGSQNLLTTLEGEVEKRLKKKEHHMSGFIKGELTERAQYIDAVEELQQIVKRCFAQAKLPEKIGGEVAMVKKMSAQMEGRLVGLLVAYQAGYGACRWPCPGKAIPEPLLDLLGNMHKDTEACKRFRTTVLEMQEAGAQVELRYVGAGDARTLWVLCDEEKRWEAQKQWLDAFSSAVDGKNLKDLPAPPFDGAGLRDMILAGLRRFLHFRSNVGTGNSEIRVKATKRVRHKDVYFQLFCLWCVLTQGGGQDVLMTPDDISPEKTVFVTRNTKRTFVDMFAGTDEEATVGQLTPAKFRIFLQQVVGKRLTIVAENSAAFRIASEPRPAGG